MTDDQVPPTARDLTREALHWIAADQTRALDRFLPMPIRNRDTLRSATETYIRESLTWKEGDTMEVVENTFDRLTDTLQEAGEDIERLFLWVESTTDWLDLETGFGHPVKYWIQILNRWAERGYREPRYLDAERMRAFVAGYECTVTRPMAEFDAVRKPLAERWLSGHEGRSDFDELLWTRYYEDLGMDPSVSVRFSYSAVLVRRWWRANRDFLTEDERFDLLAEMVAGVYDSGIAHIVEWRHMRPIDEAIDLDGMPDFDALKRDW